MPKLLVIGLLCIMNAFSAFDKVAGGASNARATGTPTLKAIPAPLHWRNYPIDWALSPTDELTIVSGRKTNWFVNPMRERIEDNLPLLLFKAEEQFVLTARVSVRFKASWDAGGLVVRANDELWGKFCFEFSVKKEPMIVSVVTRKISDDCNSMVIPGDDVYLRLAKIGKAIFFFASRDGRAWDMIRSFTLGQQLDLEIGFFSQSPVGEGCTAVFSDITYSAVPIKNVLEGQ